MLRTTVRLPDDLVYAAKNRARLTGRTLTQLLEDAVRAELAKLVSPSRVAERAASYRAPAVRAVLDVSIESAERERLATAVAELQVFLLAQPDRDSRSPDEILGYDSHGLPG